jgi:hypothetical protein
MNKKSTYGPAVKIFSTIILMGATLKFCTVQQHLFPCSDLDACDLRTTFIQIC